MCLTGGVCTLELYVIEKPRRIKAYWWASTVIRILDRSCINDRNGSSASMSNMAVPMRSRRFVDGGDIRFVRYYWPALAWLAKVRSWSCTRPKELLGLRDSFGLWLVDRCKIYKI